MLHNLNLSIGGIDARLNRRYQRLVKQHMTPPAPLASAVKDLACAQKTTFATTQAIWRFFNNERISFSQLNEPIIANRLKNDYSQFPDMWQKNTANCYQNNVAWLYFAGSPAGCT
ncbi:hypothetical protein [Symbiopectobacterium sp. RP]|uniref:hypothetical protein n=1 Tax=Symbiopectobacterium sp. RP TaxID=3248553 RepID=UPI003D288866